MNQPAPAHNPEPGGWPRRMAVGLVAGLGRGLGLLLRPLSAPSRAAFLGRFIQGVVAPLGPKRALRFYLELERRLYTLTSKAAVAYGGGVHPKHRLTGYHDFFTHNIKPGQRVLDVGCGNGSLSLDMARAGARVVGIEMNPEHLAQARARHTHPNLTYLEGLAQDYLPDEPFEVVAMSNVLEHVDQRVELLKALIANTGAGLFLIRVPLYDRSWLVPMMEEVGVDYRADDSHFLEYTAEIFNDEMRRAGLELIDSQVRWGEIWARLRPEPVEGKK